MAMSGVVMTLFLPPMASFWPPCQCNHSWLRTAACLDRLDLLSYTKR